MRNIFFNLFNLAFACFFTALISWLSNTWQIMTITLLGVLLSVIVRIWVRYELGTKFPPTNK